LLLYPYLKGVIMVRAGFAFVILFISLSFAASHASSMTMPCYEPFFTFAGSPGVIGTSCKADVIGSSARVMSYYQNYVFDFEKYLRAIEPSYYSRIYVDRVLELLEQIAIDFYNERAALEKRTYTQAELEGWMNAVLAVAYQESLMTHFQLDIRPAPSRAEKIQVLVGDAKCKVKWQVKDGKYFCPEYDVNADGKRLYSSLGMYQILLSVHSGSSKLGFFDMVHNAQYGMTLAYSAWSKIIKGTHSGLAKCQDKIFGPRKGSGNVNYVNAARSMYAVYNGGPSRVCRWTEDTIWKQNDIGYNNSLVNRPWAKIASSKAIRESRKVSVKLPNGKTERRYEFLFDLKCVREGRDLCLKKKPITQASQTPGVLFINHNPTTTEESLCTWSEVYGQFICVEDEKAAACLQQAQPEWLKEFEASRDQAPVYEMSSVLQLEGDGDILCPKLTDKILPVGSELWWPSSEAIRSWPEAVANVQDTFYYSVPVKVLGFEVRPGRNEIWYRFEYFKNSIRREGWGVL
jgi:hypothetical protein